MRILVVGGGGREHALAWALAKEAEVVAAPGNPGIAEICETVAIPVSDHASLCELCKQRSIDLVVVGPEDPLIEGLGDYLREAGFPVYGPGRDSARLEGSKAFSKAVMARSGVPTAKFETFSDPNRATEYARMRFDQGKSVAVKASGNALGKGVVVAATVDEALEAISRMMVRKEFGAAGEIVVVEDCLTGPEFSVLTLVGDHDFVSLPVAQDHKRAFDGNAGPNTGGMGAFAPVGWITQELVSKVEDTIVAPTLAQLRKEGLPYRGTLFSGIMMDEGEPHCLEFNVRMGDPETQAIMPLIRSGFAAALFAAATGDAVSPPTISNAVSVAVVVAAENYPIAGSRGSEIVLGQIPPASILFHAGTAQRGGKLVTNGGRIITATATAENLVEARSLAYQATAAVKFEGARFRSDIALS